MKKCNCYMIAGSNGAGKTTFAMKFLQGYAACSEFVNVDVIAGKMSIEAGKSIAAGRVVLRTLDELVSARKDFAFETTLSGRTYVNFLRSLRNQGYMIHMFYLWVRTSELALKRVQQRVEAGGHDVPRADVERRFHRTLSNLFHCYRPLLDNLFCFDNSGLEPKLIFEDLSGKLRIVDAALYHGLLKEVGL